MDPPELPTLSAAGIDKHLADRGRKLAKLSADADAPVHTFTNAFSKKLENLKATVAIHFAWYNFVRVHGSLRVTPAMQAKLTDHIWSLQELLAA